MLDAAGVEFEAIPSRVDEAAIKAGLDAAGNIALKLAEAKASDVSASRSGDWVVGSDSVVSVGGRTLDKPSSRDEAARHLRIFSGGQMKLTSAVALARDGEALWSHSDTATLHVRSLSDEFVETYLDAEWPEVGYCVGVFRLEGRGVQLFDRIEGNYFTILGMPLLPLLGALRERGLLLS
jgi:septum formation protein